LKQELEAVKRNYLKRAARFTLLTTLLVLLVASVNIAHATTLLISCDTPIHLTDNGSDGKALLTQDGTLLAERLNISHLRTVADFSDMPFHLYTVYTTEQDGGAQLQHTLQNLPQVIHATDNHRFHCQQITTDSLFEDQWGLERIAAAEGWSLAGGSGIVMAVIDTGIDWTHPDLQSNIWFNIDEDDGNGTPFLQDPELGWILDPADANGIDDDGNGLVDDVIGYDFTDAPEFPAAGDYLDADRDPFDEHRHGTIVASVAGAVTDNGIGIAGVAPEVQIMPLRAGNSLGFLQEDDVAAAIIYATLNGARVINMSFGDVVVAPILHDVIQWAYERDVVMVASTGNDGIEQLHFPAAWPEVIAVGAITADDYRWPLSNYGLSLDLVAPGNDIMAAIPGREYGAFSGTSLAAPFVSGAVAMMLEVSPDLPPAFARNVLRVSADDIGSPGCDNLYGAGVLMIPAALSTPVEINVCITQPLTDSRWQPARVEELQVTGTAAGNFLASWTLMLGSGENPASWTTIATSEYQQLDDSLGSIDLLNLPDGYHTLQLLAHLLDGTSLPAFSSFVVDRTPPDVLLMTSIPALQASERGRLFELEFTDPVQLEMFYAPSGSQQYQRLVSPRSTLNHCLTLLQSSRSGLTDLYFNAISSSGDSTTTPLLTCQIPEQYYPRSLHSSFTSLPYGLLLNGTTDFNHNSLPEVWLTAYDPVTHFPDLLQLWEYDPITADFIQQPATWGSAYIKDVGDIDNNGFLELLSEIGGISYLFTQTDNQSPPDLLAWRSESHWSANFITPGDQQAGYPNVLLRTTGSPRHYLTASFSAIGDSSATVITPMDTLYNPYYSTTEPFTTGVARGVEGDFDDDGSSDLLLSDNEGHLFMYEFHSTQPELVWQYEEAGLSGPGNLISGGNFTQIDREDFIAIWRTETPQSEHEVTGSRWVVQLFECTGDNEWQVQDTLAIMGMYHGSTRENGIAVGDVDEDGLDEIILTLFPEMYLLETEDDRLQPIAWRGNCNLPGTVVADFDGDGISEWLTGQESCLERVGLDDLDPLRAPAPVALSGYADSPGSLLLSWQYSEDADGFLLHRWYDGLEDISSLPGDFRQVQVTPLLTDSSYTFALRSVDASYQSDTSRFSEQIALTPNSAPWIESIIQQAPHLLRIVFSEPMSDEYTDLTRYYFTDDDVSRYPSSVISWAGNSEAFVTVDLDGFTESVTLVPRDLRDRTNTPLDSSASQLVFQWYQSNEERFFIRQGGIVDHTHFRLLFNRPVGPSIEQPGVFTFEPDDYTATSVRACDSLRFEFEVEVESSYPLGAYGRQVEVQILGILSLDSLFLNQEQSSLILQAATSSIHDAFIFPNPWRQSGGDGTEGVMIAGLPPSCEIFIYDLTGRLLVELIEDDGDGGYFWDGKTRDGTVTSGIYIVMLRQEEQIIRRKLAVIE
jgi:subtilisin family serine protease